MAGTREPCSGLHVPAVDEDRRAAVDGERHQHLECGIALDHPQPGQHLRVGQIVAGGRHPLPLRIGRRRILLWQNACHRNRVGGQRRAICAFSRDVLVFLPSCHGASTVKHR